MIYAPATTHVVHAAVIDVLDRTYNGGATAYTICAKRTCYVLTLPNNPNRPKTIDTLRLARVRPHATFLYEDYSGWVKANGKYFKVNPED